MNHGLDEQSQPAARRTRAGKRPKSPAAPIEATPYGRKLFAQLAKPFIVPADAPGEGLRLIFDLEADGLLETVTQVHCVVIGELDSGRVHEYGPERIAEALAHLGRAGWPARIRRCGGRAADLCERGGGRGGGCLS